MIYIRNKIYKIKKIHFPINTLTHLFFFTELAGLNNVSFFRGVFILCLGVSWYGLGGMLGVSLPIRLFVPETKYSNFFRVHSMEAMKAS